MGSKTSYGGSHERFYLYGGILSGGLLPEGAVTPDEEAALIESRKGELCAATIQSVEIGWSLLRGLGAPAEIPLAGPNPIPADFDLEDFLTRTLDTMAELNNWCEQCGGRFTAICPECTAGACWFCDIGDAFAARYVNGKQTSLGTGSTGPD